MRTLAIRTEESLNAGKFHLKHLLLSWFCKNSPANAVLQNKRSLVIATFFKKINNINEILLFASYTHKLMHWGTASCLQTRQDFSVYRKTVLEGGTDWDEDSYAGDGQNEQSGVAIVGQCQEREVGVNEKSQLCGRGSQSFFFSSSPLDSSQFWMPEVAAWLQKTIATSVPKVIIWLRNLYSSRPPPFQLLVRNNTLLG